MDKESPEETVQKRNEFCKQSGVVPYGPRYYDRGNQQMEFHHHSYQFHLHSQPYRARGHPRMAPWMRSRFSNPNQGNGESYNPRMFYSGRGGHGRGTARDHGVPQYSNYRGSRRHKQSHNHTYQPSPNYYSNYHHLKQSSEEYVPYNFMNSSAMFPPQHDRCLLPNGCEMIPRNLSPPGGFYTPVFTGYDLSSFPSENQEDAEQTNMHVASYCPENFHMNASSVGESSMTPEPPSLDAEPIVESPNDRRSTDSADESLSSLILTSDSSSDGYENEDGSNVSALDTADGDEKSGSSTDLTEDGSDSKDGSAEDVPEGVCSQSEHAFVPVYIYVYSSNIIDGRGNATSDELACYGVWFGYGDERNTVEEVSNKYNQDRGKTGYILGVIKALKIVKQEGVTTRIHLKMGSSFIMNNLVSWRSNFRNSENPCSSNWTEWKHFSEINELIGVIDEMMVVFQFSLADPRDKPYVLCKELVTSYWNEMKKHKLLGSPLWSPHSSKIISNQVPNSEDDRC